MLIVDEQLADVPLYAVDPGEATAVALWMPGLGGSAEENLPILERLAASGLFAVSFDPWRHGRRREETAEQLYDRVFAAFRREMWPILGRTVLDALRVLDWAAERCGGEPAIVAGGTSMGGDVAVALAGIEPRVARVAALVATPDWTRPGMQAFFDQPGTVDQGEPDAQARWLFEQLDPLSNLDRYRREVAILFECGAEDDHVPPDGALRFREALAGDADVTVNLHPGVGHGDGSENGEMIASCVRWLAVAADPS